jgi:hypothetical protein
MLASPGENNMTGRTPKKPTAKGKSWSRSDKLAATSVLERIEADEAAGVLKILLERHQNLRKEAEQIATNLVSSSSPEDVADDVLTAVSFIGIDAVNARAGRRSWGYVDPADAASELLEEALEEIISDMKRRMELGLGNAAEAMCRGIVVGLYMARETESDGALGWAPDFPAEAACNVVEELLRACPAKERKNLRDRLVKALAQDVPDWSEMLEQAAKRAISAK